jgi:hypothetical protein
MKKSVVTHIFVEPIKIGKETRDKLIFDFGRIKVRQQIEAEIWAIDEFGKATNTAIAIAIAAFAAGIVPNDLLELGDEDARAIAGYIADAAKKPDSH